MPRERPKKSASTTRCVALAFSRGRMNTLHARRVRACLRRCAPRTLASLSLLEPHCLRAACFLQEGREQERCGGCVCSAKRCSRDICHELARAHEQARSPTAALHAQRARVPDPSYARRTRERVPSPCARSRSSTDYAINTRRDRRRHTTTTSWPQSEAARPPRAALSSPQSAKRAELGREEK